MNEKCETLNAVDAEEITERNNLAVFLRVERLEAIPNKDRIELVHLKDNGYTTICEKGHKVGDLVVFIKYDTIVPDNELFAFMKEYKFRVKPRSFTERDEEDNVIKKIYSQGIVLPLQTVIDFLLSQKTDAYEQLEDFAGSLEGFDLTTILETKKYIPPAIGGGSSFGQMCSKGDFPTHIVSKTDEVNVASIVRALDELQGKPAYITLKIEGSSLTTMWDDASEELMVCSRNNQIGEHETNKFWKAIHKYGLKEKLVDSPYTLQGECYGPGIQKNKLGASEADVSIFNVIDTRNGNRIRLNYELMISVLDGLAVPMVPVVFETDSFDWTFDQLQEFADKQVYANGEIAEGIVLRCKKNFHSKILKSEWSVKIINRDYKL